MAHIRGSAFTASAAIIAVLGLSLAPIAAAQPQFESTIVIGDFATGYYQEGGPGVDHAQESRSTGWVPVWGGYYEQSADVAAEASASAGILRAKAQGSVLVNPTCVPFCSASTAFSSAVASAWDRFQIQAGGGHANGDVVQVRVLASLSGGVFLQGLPSGGNGWTFDTYFGPSNGASADNLFKVELYTVLAPPYEATVGPLQWDEVVNVEVGKSYYLFGYLKAAQNGSGFSGFGPGVYTDVVDFYGTGSLGLGYAPGYEDVVIVSAAGAPIAPAPGFTFSLAKDLTPGCKRVTGTVTLTQPAPAAGVIATLSDTLDSASTPATLKFLAGATRKTFSVTTVAVDEPETGTVSVTLEGKTKSLPLTVRPMVLSSLTLTPSTVVGSQPVVGKATLECNAGPGPITVDLSSTNAAVAYPVAASIVVPQGLKSASFDVSTNPVQAKSYATIAGAANGITKSKKLTVNVAAAVSPTSLRFGSVAVGQTAGPLSTTLTNKGAVPFSVSSISLTGTGASWFAQTNNCPASLAPGASCTISVTFTPQAALSKSAKVSIATSATATPLSVSLSGTGVLPP
jgi:hypothetical protein